MTIELELEQLETAEEAVSAPEQTDSGRGSLAAVIIAASLALGFIGNTLFYSTAPGINIALFLGLFLAFSAFMLRQFDKRIVPKHAMFILPALLFAVLLSVFSAPQLVMLNLFMSVGCLLVFLNYASTERFMGGSVLNLVMRGFDFVFSDWLKGPILTLIEGGTWLSRLKFEKTHAATSMAVIRGVILTIPLVIVFGVLLASADVVFGETVENIAQWFYPENPAQLMTQGFVVAIFTWMSLVGFALLFMLSRERANTDSITAAPVVKKGAFRLSLIESGMMLGTVDLMLLVFMGIQARYLFGGEANITTQGFTYAEYARRGFYELLAVSCLTMLLILLLDSVTHRKREREYLFQGFAVTMVVLTILLLGAAYYRLNLYQDAYGYTRIRVMSAVFMFWLGLLLLGLMVDILIKQRRLFWVGAIVTAMGFVLTLNVINMDAFIADHNIDRGPGATVALDVHYLLTLSDDAIPEIAGLLNSNTLSDGAYAALIEGLTCKLNGLDRDRDQRNLFGFHFGKDRAWRALNEHRDMLSGEVYCFYRTAYGYGF